MTIQPEAKILFVDMESPLGHMDVNHFFVRHVLPHFTNYYYLVERDLYEKMLTHYDFSEKPPAVYFPVLQKRSTNTMSIRLQNFRKISYILDFIRKNDIDCIYFLSYDTLSFYFYVKKFENYKVILMNHDNFARFLKNTLRRFILKRLKNFFHVVYSVPGDVSIIDRLRNLLNFNKILQLQYNIDDSRTITCKRPYTPSKGYLYAPSNCNDDKKIINLLGTTEGKAITVKAKVSDTTYYRYQKQYDKNIFFGFIENDEYEKEMNSADFILLLYPDDYTFRTSGILFDAIAYEKPVITDNRFLFETYLEKKGLGIFVDDAFAVEKVISRIDQTSYNRLVDNIQNYKCSYSAVKTGSDFALIIHQIMDN